VPIEIERKFLLKNNNWLEQVSHSTKIRQAYFAHGASPDQPAKASLRVRIDGEKANINIKSATLNMKRMEYEYPVPVAEATEMLDQLCEQPQIDKTRYRIKSGQHTWEIDEFYGDNQGLIVAEIELTSEDEHFEKPDWLGEEVTDDVRYYNVNLIKQPYKDW
jgi:adenylate cyclase